MNSVHSQNWFGLHVQTKENTILSSKGNSCCFIGISLMQVEEICCTEPLPLKMYYIYANTIVIAFNFTTVNSQLRMFSTPCFWSHCRLQNVGYLLRDFLKIKKYRLYVNWCTLPVEKIWVSWMEPLRPLQEIKSLVGHKNI